MFLIRLFIQTIPLAVQQITAHKVRALLTTLGIIVGVASVATVIAALQGLRGFVLEQFETVGTRFIYIDGEVPPELSERVNWRDVQIKLEEVEAIVRHCPSVPLLTPNYRTRFDLAYREEELQGVRVLGVWPEWHEIENRSVTSGRAFTHLDNDQRRTVCLVNDAAIADLGLPRDPVGEHIFVGGHRFLIIGVVETKELAAMFGGGESQAEVIVPFETNRKMSPNRWISEVVGQIVSTEAAEQAKAEVRFVLRRMRGLKPDEPDTFEVQTLQTFIDQFNALAAGITAVAGGVVAISLLVGGIGIMNIMLVSVSERTREIGLRKAVGARPTVVLLQFLVEAVTLCVAGGMMGLTLAQLLVMGLQAMPDSGLESAQIPPWAVVLSLGFSAGVGIVFGMFPAIKAARLDPIEALRHE